MNPSLLLSLLLVVSFLHGVFASGFIPILNRMLGAQAGFAFALYFAGLVLGQLAVWRFAVLSRWNRSFSLYEILFGLSLIYMGLFSGSGILISGRGIEGLAAGLATPLLFAQLVAAPSQMRIEQKIVRYNGIFALGFVLGPVLLSAGMNWFDYRICLLCFGAGFVVLNLIMAPSLPTMEQPDEANLTLRHLFSGSSWFEKFATLFFGKIFYGFLLAFITSYAGSYFPGIPVPALTVILAVLFVGGNQLGAKTLKYFNKQSLEILLPLAIGMLLLAFWASHLGVLLFVAALLHAYLLFIAFINFTTQIQSGREFALFNSLADPGMVLGALAATLELRGTWIIAAVGLLPLLYWRRWPKLLAPQAPEGAKPGL
ncbi:MAG: hypothetical protein ACAI44_34110 [Candidatus Sericytochromatia bacterium]